MKYQSIIFFVIILVLAASFRLFNINWDQGFHMQPDERAIVMAVTDLKYPTSLADFLSPKSGWNPNFFAYGSFPFYLLKIAGSIMSHFDPLFAMYDKINLVGRVLSAAFDLGTLLFVFLLGRKLFSTTIGLFASFFYATSVLSIQLSHFYAVDTLLTFFITGTLYFLLKLYEKPSLRTALSIGLLFGLALATKISATVLLSVIGATLFIDFFLLFLRKPHYIHFWSKQLPNIAVNTTVILITSGVIFALFEPYALIDFPSFWQQTHQQSLMTQDPFTFPYTLQYVDKIPYLYEFKNIVLWGLGPLLALLGVSGALLCTYLAVTKERGGKWAQELIVMIFFWAYVVVVGRFAIGFMRYMLPVYPLLCLFAALTIVRIWHLIEGTRKLTWQGFSGIGVFCIIILIWPFSFMAIYTQSPTRVQATEWILQTIPHGKTLSIEHWDDALPMYGQEKYTMLTLPMYEQDTPQKWRGINQQLEQTDYILLASNRLYTPLQKLGDCSKFSVGRCYPQTARYYQELFAGTGNFVRVAEFHAYPTIPFLHLTIDDTTADESFTVYDHPTIIIFQKKVR